MKIDFTKIIGISALAALVGCSTVSTPRDIQIMDTQVFPESATSLPDGTVFTGSVKGNIYRAEPGSDKAYPWVRFDDENKILIILGVLADEDRNVIWACSVPNSFGPERSEGVSSLMAFDLDTGEQTENIYLPPPASVCNDIAIANNGDVYISDTSNGRIFYLANGADELTFFGQDDVLNGIDGLAFSEDGTLYVNNVRTHELIRVDVDSNGKMGELTSLIMSHQLMGPDGMRSIGGNRFVQAENSPGRISIVTVHEDHATMEILTDEIISTPAVTVVGNTAYVPASNIGYLFNPELAGQEPESFMIYAVPLK